MGTRPQLTFSHVGIWVTDLEAMRAFYTDVMGFVETDRGPIGDTELASLASGGVAAGTTWVRDVTFTLPTSGPDHEVVFQLQRDDGQPLRTLRLCIDVGQAAKR